MDPFWLVLFILRINDSKSIVFLLLLAFVVIQVFPAFDLYFQQKKIFAIAEKVKIHTPLLSKIPEDHVIVSNVMDMTAYFSGRNVRLLNGYTPYGLIQLLGVKRKFAVFIVNERDEDHPAYLFPPSWLAPNGYRLVYSSADAALWLPE